MDKKTRKRSYQIIGPVIGTLVILVILTLAGLYLFAMKLHSDEKAAAEAASRLQKEGIQMLKKDLEATQVSELDNTVKESVR